MNGKHEKKNKYTRLIISLTAAGLWTGVLLFSGNAWMGPGRLAAAGRNGGNQNVSGNAVILPVGRIFALKTGDFMPANLLSWQAPETPAEQQEEVLPPAAENSASEVSSDAKPSSGRKKSSGNESPATPSEEKLPEKKETDASSAPGETPAARPSAETEIDAAHLWKAICPPPKTTLPVIKEQ